MKSLLKLIDHLLLRAISLTGTQVYGLADFVEVDVLPEYLDPESPRRRPARRLRCALP